MGNEQTTIAIINATAIVLPSVVGLIKALTAKLNPDAPVPTDAEVKAAFVSACISSLAKDDEWLATHPGV